MSDIPVFDLLVDPDDPTKTRCTDEVRELIPALKAARRAVAKAKRVADVIRDDLVSQLGLGEVWDGSDVVLDVCKQGNPRESRLRELHPQLAERCTKRAVVIDWEKVMAYSPEAYEDCLSTYVVIPSLRSRRAEKKG